MRAIATAPRFALAPVHPGEVLRETVLPALGKSAHDVAAVLEVDACAFAAVVDGRAPVTADLALRLGKLCGNGPDVWLSLQSAFDLRAAEPAARDAVGRIPTLQEVAA